MKRAFTYTVMVVFLLGALCTLAAASSEEYREFDDGSTVKIAVGGYVNVSLFNNLSVGGYDWNLSSYDHAVLELTYEGFMGSEMEPGDFIVSGRDEWTFKGLHDGETTLKFKKVNGEGDVQLTFTLKVVVGHGAEKKDSGYEAGMMLIGCVLMLGAVLYLNRKK